MTPPKFRLGGLTSRFRGDTINVMPDRPAFPMTCLTSTALVLSAALHSRVSARQKLNHGTTLLRKSLFPWDRFEGRQSQTLRYTQTLDTVEDAFSLFCRCFPEIRPGRKSICICIEAAQLSSKKSMQSGFAHTIDA